MNGKRFAFWGKGAPITLAVVLLMLVAASAAAYYFLLDPNRFIPRAQAMAQDATGLPVSIEGMHWAFNPAPVLVFSNVEIGDEVFGATAVNIRAQLDIASLLRRKPEVPEVSLSGVQLRLPLGWGETGKRFTAVVRHGRSSEASDEQGAQVHRITAAGVRVLRGGQPWAHVDAQIDGVTDPTVGISANLAASGPEAEGGLLALNLNYVKATSALNGSASLKGPALALLPELGQQDLAVDLAAAIEGDAETPIAARVSGAFTSATYEQQGSLDAAVFWQQGRLVVNDLKAISQDCNIHLDTTITPGSEAAFEIYTAEIGSKTLSLVSAAMMPAAVQFVAAPDAAIHVKEVLGAFPLAPGARARFERGEAGFAGFTVRPGPGGGTWPALCNAEGAARVQENRVLIDSLKGQGFTFKGEAGPAEDGAMALSLSGSIDLTTLDVKNIEAMKDVKSMQGAIAVETLQIAGAAEEGGPVRVRFSGRAEEAGFSLQLPDTEKPVTAKGINGGITFDGATLSLLELKGDGFRLSGSVQLTGPEENRRFALSGETGLTHPLVQFALAKAPLRDLAGRIEIQKLEGAVPREGAAPEFELQGAIRDASFKAKMGDTTLKASKINGEVKTQEKVVSATLSMQTDPLGSLKWDGTLNLADQQVKGSLRVNVPRAASAFAPAVRSNNVLRQAVDTYGEATIALEARLPREGQAPRIEFRSKEDPPLEASLGFAARKDGGWALDAVKLDTTVPLRKLDFPGPMPITATGQAKVALERPGASKEFTVRVGMEGADIHVGEYLHKQPGQELHATLTGDGANWKPRTLEVQLLDQPLRFTFEDGALAAKDLQLNLGALSSLFPEDVKTKGTIHASFDADPLNVNAQLDDVALALSPAIRVDLLSGGIAYAGGVWSFTKLHAVGADSDFILDVGLRNSRWDGSISGQRINLNTMQEMQKAFAENKAQEGSVESTGDCTSPGLHGELQIELAQLVYQRATLENLAGRLVLTPGQYDFSDMQSTAGAGAVQGRIIYRPELKGTPGQANVELTLRSVDAAAIDALMFPNPRGMSGKVDATIDLVVPVQKDVPPYMGLTGRVEYEAKDGTYGSAGGADRLLSVLRATEIFRLTLPGMGEASGMAFGHTNATIIAQRGVLNIERFFLTSRSYEVQAEGTIDFPQDTTDVRGNFSMLEGITGIAQAVPVLGGALQGVKGTASIAFNVSGSPFDVQVSARPGINPIENTKAGIKGVFEDVTNVKGLFGLRKNKR